MLTQLSDSSPCDFLQRIIEFADVLCSTSFSHELITAWSISCGIISPSRKIESMTDRLRGEVPILSGMHAVVDKSSANKVGKGRMQCLPDCLAERALSAPSLFPTLIVAAVAIPAMNSNEAQHEHSRKNRVQCLCSEATCSEKTAIWIVDDGKHQFSS